MRALSLKAIFTVGSTLLVAALPAAAQDFNFSTGDPDGLIATASRPSTPGKTEIESADDFVLTTTTAITSATFTGILTGGVDVSNIGQVRAEIYRVFPKDSTDPPSGNVPTRVNSPSDVAFAERDSADSSLSFSTTVLNQNSSANNSVINGINPIPGVFTGGEGPVTGVEVQFTVNFSSAFVLPADHYFFIPQVAMNSPNAEFLWLSAPRPIVPPGTPFAPDLQSWIRNEDLDPDWLRIGTDITQQGPFNAAFSLQGNAVAPEPGSQSLVLMGLLPVAGLLRRRLVKQ